MPKLHCLNVREIMARGWNMLPVGHRLGEISSPGGVRAAALHGLVMVVALTAGGLASPACAQAQQGGVVPAGAQPTAGDIARVEQKVEVLEGGSSTRAARKKAATFLPLHQMSARDRKRAEDVVKHCSVFREMPMLRFECDPHVYRYFVNYPDAAASIWRVMQISKFQMYQTGQNEFEADAGDGTIGVIDVLVRGERDNVIYCEGEYRTPVLGNAIKTRAVIHLQTAHGVTREGTPVVTHRAWLYVWFPSATIETIAKVMSPVSNVMIDRNFREVSMFLHLMTIIMRNQPQWAQQSAGKMTHVSENKKATLVQVANHVARTARNK